MAPRTGIVVTGAAGGLGAATAARFAKAGHAVHGFDLGAAESPGHHSALGITYHDVDVREDDSVRDAFAAVAEKCELTGLVHCAGIAAFGPTNPGQLIDPQSAAVLDNLSTVENVLRTNLLGTFSVVRHAASHIARRGNSPDEENGFIILTSSGAALEGKAGQSAYSASKAGVIGMTLPLAREFSPFGIRVVTIAPGLFDTPILQDTPRIERHVPFPQRIGHPDEFAALAYHIAENPYINADVMRIDGGTRGEFRSTTPFIR